MRIDMTGARALVTGGANGIGFATASLLRECGAEVLIADLARETPSRAAAEIGALAVEMDVSDAASINAVFERAGELDIVIINAGVASLASVETTTPETWDRTLAVNLTGAFLTLQAAARGMIPRSKGAIVLTASTNSFDGEPYLSAYNASKSGLLGLLHTAANELGPRGIRVNAVCPGYIRTRLTAEGFAHPEFLKNYFRHVPLGRGGEVLEVARAAVFLASDLASYITGAHLLVDGGQMAGKFGIWNESNARFDGQRWTWSND